MFLQKYSQKSERNLNLKKFNYHTHSVFCDGENTPLEIVQKALKLGISELGIFPVTPPCCRCPETTLSTV